MENCEVHGCENMAEVIDDVGTYMCKECMNEEIESEGTLAEEYEDIYS